MGRMKLESIEGKTSSWVGLWWHPEINGFTSEAIDLSELRKFKGRVRLYMRKNKFYNNGENGRPNYNFCLRDVNAGVFNVLDVEDYVDKDHIATYDFATKRWETESGNRLYSHDEVREIIRGTWEDCKSGYDYMDIIPEDFV